MSISKRKIKGEKGDVFQNQEKIPAFFKDGENSKFIIIHFI